jgi:hypothetical protein
VTHGGAAGSPNESWTRASGGIWPGFLAFATNESIVAALAHRTAAVEDSRLLPLVERAFNRDAYQTTP